MINRKYYWGSYAIAVADYVYAARSYQTTPDTHPANRWRAACCWQAAFKRGLVDC